MQFSDLRQTEEKALPLFERLGKKAVLAAAAALLLLSVGLFLLMRGVPRTCPKG
ncbi:unknown [Sutterella sp. CAG:397]|nr:unknown [Sutterella sp. CAG:397]